MRPLEYVLTFALIAGFCGMIAARFRPLRKLHFALLLPLPVAMLQALFEGQRWQMYPAYVLALLFSFAWIVRFRYHERLRPNLPIKLIGTILTAGAVIISIALPELFPVFSLSKPSGPYSIGTITYHWTDTNRQDIYSKNPSDKRQLMVQIWYPAKDTSSLPRAPYVDDAQAISTGLTKDLGLPSFIFDHFAYVKTHAAPSAPVATDKASYPVLIYLTGLAGFRQSSMFQIENLVSHGYMVVGVDQPYSSAAVAFPNGKIAYSLSEHTTLPFINQSLSPSEKIPMLNGRPLPTGIIPYLAKDVTFTLDKLTALHTLSSGSSLPSRFDLDHVGIFGISLGAMTSAEACHEDPRLKACLMMDAAIPTDVATTGLRQPGMWITRPAADMRLENTRAGGWPEKDIKQTLSTMQATYNKSQPGNGYYVSIGGMFHHNFFDVPYWSPVMSAAGLTGPIDAQRGFAIVNTYSLNFFNKALMKEQSQLLDSSSHIYPEVAFQKK